jgi:hypothetical protein
MIPTLFDKVMQTVIFVVLAGIWIAGTLWHWWMVFFPIFVSFCGGIVQMIKQGGKLGGPYA